MKKVLLILLAAMAVFATSCSDNQAPAAPPLLHVAKQFDTMVYTTKITTAPRYSCSGHRLREPKLTSVKTVGIPIHFTVDTTVGGSAYNKGAYEPIPQSFPTETGVNGGSDTHHNGDMPEWVKSLLWVLFILAALALLVFLLWWMYNEMQRHISATASSNEVSSHSAGTAANDAVSGTGSTSAGASAGTADQIASGEVAIMKQLQETGGTYERYADGGVKMDIPDQSDPSAIFISLTILKEAKKKKEA